MMAMKKSKAKTQQYWSERLSDNVYNKNTKKAEKKLKQIYRKANKELQNQINALYVEMLENGGEISASALYQGNRYSDLVNAIDKNVQAIGRAEEKSIQMSLFDSFKDAYVGAGKMLPQVKIDWTLVNPRIVEELVNANIKGANFSDRVWKNKDKLKNLLEDQLTNTIVNGTSKDVAVKVLKERLGVGFNQADAIVRTETMRVINSGQAKSYEDNGYERYTNSVHHDDRTSDICGDIDESEEFYFRDMVIGENCPPYHVSCRTTIIPVISSRAE